MAKDTQSRKWQLTINNPTEKNLCHTKIKEILYEMKSIIYYCLADEVGGDKNTHHTHLYVAFSSAVRFSTLKNRFNEAHIEYAKGTSAQNRDYISKDGKWLNNSKHGTSIPNTFEEWGDLPVERQGARSDLADLLDQIKSGVSTVEILDENPNHILNVERIEKVRQTFIAEKYKDVFRQLDVTYVWGKTGTGKTRTVLEKHGYENVYRVTDYKNPFDRYKSEEVIVFDEFNSQFRINDLLNYLDGYPLELPCRYNNKTACYTLVYLISNSDLREQYRDIQNEKPLTYEALLRRIHKVIKYTAVGEFEESHLNEYLEKDNSKL